VDFWSWRGSRAAALPVAPQAAPQQSELEPIRVFTVRGEYAGTINPRGQRVTDLLNAQPALLVRLDEPGTSGEWVSIDRDTILVVAPPPSVSPRRIHRQRTAIRVRIGDWVATGVVHTTPASGLDLTQLGSRQRFLPMTDVWIARADGTADGEQFAVAIINVGNVDELHELSLV
jgi:hypothetical protein